MSLFFYRKVVDKWKNSPQNVDNWWIRGTEIVHFSTLSTGYPQVVNNLYVNKGGRNGL